MTKGKVALILLGLGIVALVTVQLPEIRREYKLYRMSR